MCLVKKILRCIKVKSTVPGVEQACVSPLLPPEHPEWTHGDGDCELSKVGKSQTFLCLFIFLLFILKYI